MAINDVFVFASIVSTTINILYVALGLGLVIFFHELGHFAVAKWCNVNVERFSIGFGPILWSFKRGETEYALSVIPFGGYVKMLGQDDMDPSQLTSDEIARDPRSYSAKNVPQRMAIISAGVIMNIITAMLFFAIAFGIGVETSPSTLGHVGVGGRAWQAGLMSGDNLGQINDRQVSSFSDIIRGVALTSGELQISGTHRDETPFGPIGVLPDGRGTRRKIGVGPTRNLTIFTPFEGTDLHPIAPGTPAAEADPTFEPGDRIIKIGSNEVKNFASLRWTIAEQRDKDVKLTVQRGNKTVVITLKANPFRTLGLSMDIGEIAAIRRGSPAERAGLKPGDKIAKVNGEAIGGTINPLHLPDKFETYCRERETVELEVLRKDEGKETVAVKVEFRDSDQVIPAWFEIPMFQGTPLSIPSLGVAFHMIPTIVAVKEGSPAEKAKIVPNERLEKIQFIPNESTPDGMNKNETITIEFGKKDKKSGEEVKNWAHAFWLMQMVPTRNVTLTVVDAKGESREVDLTPARADGWYFPTRGFQTEPLSDTQQATGFVDALQMGTKRAKDSVLDVYLTLTSLFGGRISPKEFSGPVNIAKFAYRAVEQGVPSFLLFLGFLSINLAVLNFLPIPILDGGHMVFLCWEAVTRKKPSERVMIAATYVGLAFVLSLMAFVLYLDIFVNR